MPRSARVILASYNQLPLLRLAIRGYLRQTTNDFALTVADDGSRQDTLDFLEVFRPELEARGIALDVVTHDDRGFRKTVILNEAVRRSQGERLLIFSDGDCVPPADFVERHINAHEPRSFHVGGAYRLTEAAAAPLTEADIDAGRYEDLGTAADRRDLRRRRRKSTLGVMLRRRNRPKILGLNFAIDRALFEEINGFDERFQSWGVGEDSDVRDRLMRCRPRPNVKVFYGTCDVYHLWHSRGASGGRAKHADYYKSERPVHAVAGLHPQAERQAPESTHAS